MRFTKDSVQMTDEEFCKLLEDYQTTGDVEARNKLVMKYAYIPQTVAIQLRGLANGYAQVDDMVNQGIITLIDSLDRFDPKKGIAFEYYAFMRVKGGIIDLVRKQDWIPRRVRNLEKRINEKRNYLLHTLGREPSDEEIAKELEISVDKLHSTSQEINNSVVFSFEELIQNMSQFGSSLETEGMSPEKTMVKAEMNEILAKAIDALSEREKLVVSLYYYEELTLSEIAQVLGISAQRVSQINTRAVSKLKDSLSEYIYG